MKLKDYFFDNFMGIDESTVLTAVEELTDGQKNLVYYIWGVDSKHRNPNSKQAKYVISQIYKKLYKKNLFNEFNAPKETVIKLIDTLKEKELVNLFTEYSYKDNELKSGVVTKEIRQKNLYIIKKVQTAIKEGKVSTRKVDYSSVYKGFFNQFDRPKEEVLRVVYSLDEESIKTLKKKFGENFDKLYKVDNKVNDEINVRICRLIRRKFAFLENGEFVKITDYVNLDLDTIKERMSLLSTKEQERIYSLFGKNLDKEVAVNFEQKNSLLRKKSIERLKSGKLKLVHTNFKPLFLILSKNKFDDETMEEFKLRVLKAIDSLQEKDKDILIKKYGENFDLTTTKNIMTTQENEYITRFVITKLSWSLKDREIKKYKGLFERVNAEEKYLLLEFIDTLSNEDKMLLQKKYGVDYSNTSELHTFSSEDNHRIKVMLEKAVHYFNRKSKEKYVGVRINSLRDMRNIARSKEYKELLSYFSENESLAVLTYLARKLVSTEEITKVTGVSIERLHELVSEYNNLGRNINVLKRNI